MFNHEQGGSLKIKIGISLFVISNLAFGALFCTPFLDFSWETKAKLSVVFIVVSEITFWGSVLLLGREVVRKYKQYFNPLNWFTKKDDEDPKAK